MLHLLHVEVFYGFPAKKSSEEGENMKNFQPFARHSLKLMIWVFFITLCSGGIFLMSNSETEAASNPRVIMKTSLGDIQLELFMDKAPITVKNFMKYVDKGFFTNTLFHRVIPGFMIQGGGFTPGMAQKETDPPIKNEAGNGLSNARGTIAMARTSIVDSATSQFFINVVDNTFLDHQNNSQEGFGYCVFGKVTKGMDVVDKIVSVPRGIVGGNQDVPNTDVLIKSVKRIK
jgi:cyclophilin family peptidyl-prolyl cis-trans isomerase